MSSSRERCTTQETQVAVFTRPCRRASSGSIIGVCTRRAECAAVSSPTSLFAMSRSMVCRAVRFARSTVFQAVRGSFKHVYSPRGGSRDAEANILMRIDNTVSAIAVYSKRGRRVLAYTLDMPRHVEGRGPSHHHVQDLFNERIGRADANDPGTV